MSCARNEVTSSNKNGKSRYYTLDINCDRKKSQVNFRFLQYKKPRKHLKLKTIFINSKMDKSKRDQHLENIIENSREASKSNVQLYYMMPGQQNSADDNLEHLKLVAMKTKDFENVAAKRQKGAGSYLDDASSIKTISTNQYMQNVCSFFDRILTPTRRSISSAKSKLIGEKLKELNEDVMILHKAESRERKKRNSKKHHHKHEAKTISSELMGGSPILNNIQTHNKLDNADVRKLTPHQKIETEYGKNIVFLHDKDTNKVTVHNKPTKSIRSNNALDKKITEVFFKRISKHNRQINKNVESASPHQDQENNGSVSENGPPITKARLRNMIHAKLQEIRIDDLKKMSGKDLLKCLIFAINVKEGNGRIKTRSMRAPKDGADAKRVSSREKRRISNERKELDKGSDISLKSAHNNISNFTLKSDGFHINVSNAHSKRDINACLREEEQRYPFANNTFETNYVLMHRSQILSSSKSYKTLTIAGSKTRQINDINAPITVRREISFSQLNVKPLMEFYQSKSHLLFRIDSNSYPIPQLLYRPTIPQMLKYKRKPKSNIFRLSARNSTVSVYTENTIVKKDNGFSVRGIQPVKSNRISRRTRSFFASKANLSMALFSTIEIDPYNKVYQTDSVDLHQQVTGKSSQESQDLHINQSKTGSISSYRKSTSKVKITNSQSRTDSTQAIESTCNIRSSNTSMRRPSKVQCGVKPSTPQRTPSNTSRNQEKFAVNVKASLISNTAINQETIHKIVNKSPSSLHSLKRQTKSLVLSEPSPLDGSSKTRKRSNSVGTPKSEFLDSKSSTVSLSRKVDIRKSLTKTKKLPLQINLQNIIKPSRSNIPIFIKRRKDNKGCSVVKRNQKVSYTTKPKIPLDKCTLIRQALNHGSQDRLQAEIDAINKTTMEEYDTDDLSVSKFFPFGNQSRSSVQFEAAAREKIDPLQYTIRSTPTQQSVRQVFKSSRIVEKNVTPPEASKRSEKKLIITNTISQRKCEVLNLEEPPEPFDFEKSERPSITSTLPILEHIAEETPSDLNLDKSRNKQEGDSKEPKSVIKDRACFIVTGEKTGRIHHSETAERLQETEKLDRKKPPDNDGVKTLLANNNIKSPRHPISQRASIGDTRSLGSSKKSVLNYSNHSLPSTKNSVHKRQTKVSRIVLRNSNSEKDRFAKNIVPPKGSKIPLIYQTYFATMPSFYFNSDQVVNTWPKRAHSCFSIYSNTNFDSTLSRRSSLTSASSINSVHSDRKLNAFNNEDLEYFLNMGKTDDMCECCYNYFYPNDKYNPMGKKKLDFVENTVEHNDSGFGSFKSNARNSKTDEEAGQKYVKASSDTCLHFKCCLSDPLPKSKDTAVIADWKVKHYTNFDNFFEKVLQFCIGDKLVIQSEVEFKDYFSKELLTMAQMYNDKRKGFNEMLYKTMNGFKLMKSKIKSFIKSVDRNFAGSEEVENDAILLNKDLIRDHLKVLQNYTKSMQTILPVADISKPLDFLLLLGYSTDNSINLSKNINVSNYFYAIICQIKLLTKEIQYRHAVLIYLLLCRFKLCLLRYLHSLTRSIINGHIDNYFKLDKMLCILEASEDTQCDILGIRRDKIGKNRKQDKMKNFDFIQRNIFNWISNLLNGPYKKIINAEYLEKLMRQGLLQSNIQVEAVIILMTLLLNEGGKSENCLVPIQNKLECFLKSIEKQNLSNMGI